MRNPGYGGHGAGVYTVLVEGKIIPYTSDEAESWLKKHNFDSSYIHDQNLLDEKFKEFLKQKEIAEQKHKEEQAELRKQRRIEAKIKLEKEKIEKEKAEIERQKAEIERQKELEIKALAVEYYKSTDERCSDIGIISKCTKDLSEAIFSGRRRTAEQIVRDALIINHISIKTLIQDGLYLGFMNAFDSLENGSIYFPEVMVSAKACENALKYMQPFFEAEHIYPKGSVTIVNNYIPQIRHPDYIISSLLKCYGFTVSHALRFHELPEPFWSIKLPESLINDINNGTRIIYLSPESPEDFSRVSKTSEELKNAGLRDKCKLIMQCEYITNDFDKNCVDAIVYDYSSGIQKVIEFSEKTI